MMNTVLHRATTAPCTPGRRVRLEMVMAGMGVLAAMSAAQPAQDVRAQAKAIIQATGVRGGFIVHLGCGEGRLTEALRLNDHYTVQGLERDPALVQAARERLQREGVYGPVSVERLDGTRLPYADNLVDLVVGQAGTIPQAEILRVLTPRGVAYLRAGDEWTKTVKPYPADLDEWSHFLHDPTNNAVAADEAVGPPRSVRWIAPPLWLRSHETPSGIEGAVTAGGRLFYFFDAGLIGITDQRFPERWQLVCREAFNGKLLWKRPLEHWGWPEWAWNRFHGKDWTEITGGRTVVPNENHRRLVVDGDRLYATLTYRGPLMILDAATGTTLATVGETTPAREFVSARGVVVVYSGGGISPAARRRGRRTSEPAFLRGIDGASGDVLWKREVEPLRSLFLAVDGNRVVYQAGKTLHACELKTGRPMWEAAPIEKQGRTLVVHDGVVLILGGKAIEARDDRTGALLWHERVPLQRGLGSTDLFVADGLVWPSVLSVDVDQHVRNRTPHALAIGYDLRTGEEKRRIFVKNLRSPEHHHRCYRNKATDRYLITAMEGAEFLDLRGDRHSQNNFLRGACRFGVLPANGLLYVPPDQCFCEPGAKLLGFVATGPDARAEERPVPDSQRLERGPAFGAVAGPVATAADWPTYRHDPARHGTTTAPVGEETRRAWQVKLGGGLTQPIAVGKRVYVASRDAHAVHALDLATGRRLWTFTAGGRIDSPPTWYRGLLLFGSADGYVYCLRADDGALAWRFLAAPSLRFVGCFDQFESAWPVHGSVLVVNDVAYFTAGRSTYLDGGIRVYGVEPATGRVLYRTTLSGPFPDRDTHRDYSFYLLGANSDILVAEGGWLYMRQKKLTPSLKEIQTPVLSTKGEQDTGLHVFSTAALLDGSWYNRTFWMYAKRWPGFQLANQAPKAGQLLVVDDTATYAVKVFYHRNIHSPMFFPGKDGYLLFADKNTTEPQIVGEPGARKPLAWLPQSGYKRPKGVRPLDSPAFGLDKMIGYTRADSPLWTRWLKVRIRAMVKAGDRLFVAGPPDVFDPNDPYGPFEGRCGARFVVVSAAEGKPVAERPLDAVPVFDGLIAASGRLLMSMQEGTLRCYGG